MDDQGEEVRAYTDGACRCGNPGECSAAFVVFDSSGYIMASDSLYLGPQLHTNNYAEYQGMLYLLRWAENSKVTDLDIYCDSKLVVNQVMGLWNVSSEELKPLHLQAFSMRIRGDHCLHHIKGHSGNPGNEYVDKLCNEILDKELGVK